MRIGINGFGRIGRALFRVLHEREGMEVVAINDTADVSSLAHLLKYDSIHRQFTADVEISGQNILIDGRIVSLTHESQLENISWKDCDVVIESTGKFLTKLDLEKHLKAGAKKVILAASPEGDDVKMVVLGVNDYKLNESDSIVSNASCTTNCAAPMIKVLDKRFGVKSAYVTTVHSYTSDQSLHDSIHNDLRRARSAPNSIIPTTTGAAKALSYIFPNIELNGCGIRVPVANCSLIDVTCILNQSTSTKNINSLFKQESANDFKDIICYNVDPIVSIDVTSSPYSCIFDSELTHVSANMVKVVGWYDNEYGYCSRLVDLLMKIT